MAPKQLNRRTVVVIGILSVAAITVVAILLGRPWGDEDDRGGDPVALLESDTSTNRAESSAPAPSNLLSGRRGAPSRYPSSRPSLSPSDIPTSAPSVPLVDLFVDPNPIPSNPSPTYFNYDENDSDYGPGEWAKVDTSNSSMKEFSEEGFGAWQGHLADQDVTKNRCDPSTRDEQSPLDLRQSDESEAICDAVHQIRSRPGKLPLSSDKIIKRIEPNKLSIIMNRRACLDENDEVCNVDRGPVADYPRYSGGQTPFSDLLQWDLKVPGEHWIKGESFDAEIQMLHSHLDSPRVSSIGVPIRASENGFNAAFQEILDQFQLTYDMDKAKCDAKTSTRRRAAGLADVNLVEYDNNRTPRENQPTVPIENPDLARQLQLDLKEFNPYSLSFLNTIFFFRYDGTTTDPPCVTLTWWVMSSPMRISFEQLNQAKYLLFTHVNGDCEKTSVHNADQSVARPLQKQADEQFVMECKEGDFKADFSE